jgi:hypothetical protein
MDPKVNTAGASKRPWLVALPLGVAAIALAALSSAAYAHHAKTCTGGLVRDPTLVGARARELPPMATPLVKRSALGFFDSKDATDAVPPLFQLGPFELRDDFGPTTSTSSMTTSRPIPPVGSVSVEDPSSCDASALELYHQGQFSFQPLDGNATIFTTLRHDAARDEWLVTFPAPGSAAKGSMDSYEVLPADPSDPVVAGNRAQMAAVAFRRAPKETPVPPMASFVGGILLLVGLRDLLHARRGGRAAMCFGAACMAFILSFLSLHPWQ